MKRIFILPKSESFNKDIIIISVVWLLCATAIFFYKWESISTLVLNDNDDYMRFVQFQEWMNNGRWYLKPMDNFNAADGIVIHWSRFPDLILSAIAYPLLFVVDESTAYSLSISIVPLLYLLFYSLSCFYLCNHYFGERYRFLSMMFALFSPSVMHFIPGSIDHHNIQLILAILFLSLTPITVSQINQLWRVYAQSILLALSLWTGLDNILLFASFFIVYTVYCFFVSKSWFVYVSRLYLFCGVSVVISVLLNRPYNEFFDFKYDEVSFVIVVLFFVGWAFVNNYNWFKFDSWPFGLRSFVFVILGVGYVTPVVFLYPNITSALFVDYPPILQTYWLDHVSEAKSIFQYVSENGLLSIDNYVLLVIPALLYPFFRVNNHHCTILYIIFVLNLVLAIFWQVRVIRLCFILSSPFQAYVVIRLSEFVKYSIFKVLIILLGAPLVMAFLVIAVGNDDFERNTIENDKKTLFRVLEEKGIESKVILTGIETGAPVLARTNNRIIAAPYHRNIVGNQFLIEVMLEGDMSLAKDEIQAKNIDYIVIGNDAHLMVLKKSASEEALINKLYSSNVPSWLETIYDDVPDGYRIFRVRESL